VTAKTRPPWCGNPNCNPDTRMVELGDEKIPRRCPCVGRSSLLEELERARAEVARLEAAIAAEGAPEWVRGPGVRT
jgi:hypothetical protein